MCPNSGKDCAARTLGSALAGPGPIKRRGGICGQSINCERLSRVHHNHANNTFESKLTAKRFDLHA